MREVIPPPRPGRNTPSDAAGADEDKIDQRPYEREDPDPAKVRTCFRAEPGQSQNQRRPPGNRTAPHVAQECPGPGSVPEEESSTGSRPDRREGTGQRSRSRKNDESEQTYHRRRREEPIKMIADMEGELEHEKKEAGKDPLRTGPRRHCSRGKGKETPEYEEYLTDQLRPRPNPAKVIKSAEQCGQEQRYEETEQLSDRTLAEHK